ncbi:MAG: efflux RND transporter periplasmic adaptor subunit [Cyanobacteria bacterium J06598_1]
MNPHSPDVIHPLSLTQRAKRVSPRWFIGLGLLGLLLVGIPVLRSRSAASSSTSEPVSAGGGFPVETVVAESVSAYGVSRSYTGEITSLRASELGFERSGQLTALLVPEGAQVGAGEPLAQLDVRNLQTQRLQIEAEKARAMAQMTELEVGARQEDVAAAQAAVQDLEQQMALQRTQLARREILYEKGAISEEALDEFSFGEGALEARLNQARAQLLALENGTRPEQLNAQGAVVQQLDARLADLDVTISKSTLYAPFAGTVAEHKVDLGTVVGAGASVVRLVENGIPEARIGVPTGDIRRLSVGEERTVVLGDEQYTGTITSVLPEVDPQTLTQTVVLQLEPRASARVSPGQTARLNLTEQISAEGIWLPTEALTQGVRGLWTTYVVVPAEPTENEQDERNRYVTATQSVEVIYQEGDRVLVTGTLQPGDLVVASGSHRLVPGQQVTPVEAN